MKSVHIRCVCVCVVIYIIIISIVVILISSGNTILGVVLLLLWLLLSRKFASVARDTHPVRAQGVGEDTMGLRCVTTALHTKTICSFDRFQTQ